MNFFFLAFRDTWTFKFLIRFIAVRYFYFLWCVKRAQAQDSHPSSFEPHSKRQCASLLFFYGYHNNPVDSVCASHIFYLSSCDYKITDGSLWWNFQGNFSLISLIIVNMVDRSEKTWNFCYPRIQFSERKIHQRHIFHPWGFRRPENNAQWFSIVNRIYHTSELNFSRALIG